MKKMLGFLLVAVLAAVFIPVIPVSAADEFQIQDGALIRYLGNGSDIVIPSGVKEIRQGAFRDNQTIRSVTIPEGVTAIGFVAFFNCSNLESVSLPASLTRIEENVFAHCAKLDKLTLNPANKNFALQDGVLYSKDMTVLYFYPAPSPLKEFTIPATVVTISERAFSSPKNLIKLNIPAKTRAIKTSAFSYCDSLREYSVDKSSTSLSTRDGVLFDAAGTMLLYFPVDYQSDSYTVPNGVRVIAPYAFFGCTKLKSIVMPDSVTEIGAWAFASCFALADITLSKNLESIKSYAFSNTRFSSINLPDSLISIGSEAFSKSRLTSITIPKRVSDIGYGAFAFCRSLTSFIVDKDNGTFFTVDGALFLTNGMILHSYPGGQTRQEYTIPDYIRGLGKYAFYGDATLKEVTVSSGIGVISEYAFSECTALTKVTIQNGTSEIAESAFSGCGGLKTVELPKSVNKIANSAFGWSNGFKIISVAGSYAEQFAKSMNIGFEAEKAVPNEITVILDGKQVQAKSGQAPFVYSDRTYMALKDVFDALGIALSWDNEKKTATGMYKGSVIKFTIGEYNYQVDGVSHKMDVVPMISNGRTCMPAKYVAEAIGYTAIWDAKTRTVILAD